MMWKEIWSRDIESSKSVSLRVSVSEAENGAKIFGIRRWIQRGDEKIPTKDGFAVQLTTDTVDKLIEALKEVKAGHNEYK
jgi:F0F1-type ATP synthase alpha subunit